MTTAVICVLTNLKRRTRTVNVIAAISIRCEILGFLVKLIKIKMTIPPKTEEVTLGADCELRFEIESKECVSVEVIFNLILRQTPYHFI